MHFKNVPYCIIKPFSRRAEDSSEISDPTNKAVVNWCCPDTANRIYFVQNALEFNAIQRTVMFSDCFVHKI